jgi:DNA repair exonuclease SbcCD nuclease subunit
MITLVWRSDVHLADHPPQSRTDNWRETLLGKIRQVGEIAREVDAHAVLDGGDFFNIRSPFRNSHQLVFQATVAHEVYPCPVYANIGNHDVKYGDYRFLPEQPLGVLFESGVFKRLYDDFDETFVPMPVTGMGFDYKVRVVGIPYHGHRYDWERFTRIKKGREDVLVAVAHVLASPKGGTMFEGEDIVKYDDLDDLAPDVWCFGHWHKNQGVTQLPSGKWVVNVGSLSRGSIAQDDVKRTPTVAILRFDPEDGIEIETREIEVRPSNEVFDLEGRVRAESRAFSMETFVDSIHETLSETEQQAIPDVIRALPDVPEPVRERATVYWEESQ